MSVITGCVRDSRQCDNGGDTQADKMAVKGGTGGAVSPAGPHRRAPVAGMALSMEVLLAMLFWVSCVLPVTSQGSQLELCTFDQTDNACSFHVSDGWIEARAGGAGRGPQGNHTTGGGKFLRLKDQGSHMFASSRWFSGIVCLTFSYFLKRHNSVSLTVIMNSTNSQTAVWHGAPSDVTDWGLVQITVKANVSFTLVFNGTKASSSGYLAIDDVSITTGSCVLPAVSQVQMVTIQSKSSFAASRETAADYASVANVSQTTTAPPGTTATAATFHVHTTSFGGWGTASAQISDRPSGDVSVTTRHRTANSISPLSHAHYVTALTKDTAPSVTASLNLISTMGSAVTRESPFPAVPTSVWNGTKSTSLYDVTGDTGVSVGVSVSGIRETFGSAQRDSEKQAWEISTVVLTLVLLATWVTIFFTHWCKRYRVNLARKRQDFRGRVVMKYKRSENRNTYTERMEREDSFYPTASPRDCQSAVSRAAGVNSSPSCFQSQQGRYNKHGDNLDYTSVVADDNDSECHSETETEAGRGDDGDDVTSNSSGLDINYAVIQQVPQTLYYRENPPSPHSVSLTTQREQPSVHHGAHPVAALSLVSSRDTDAGQTVVPDCAHPGLAGPWIPSTHILSVTSPAVGADDRGGFHRVGAVMRGVREYRAREPVSDDTAAPGGATINPVGGRQGGVCGSVLTTSRSQSVDGEAVYGNIQTASRSQSAHPARSDRQQSVEKRLGFGKSLDGTARGPTAVCRGATSQLSQLSVNKLPHASDMAGGRTLQLSATPSEVGNPLTFGTFLGSRKGQRSGICSDKRELSEVRRVELGGQRVERSMEKAERVHTHEGGAGIEREATQSFILRI